MDADEFRRTSHAVWEAMAPGWDRRHAFFEATARPVTERMLERLGLTPGQTILELAAGTGIAGFAAARHVAPGGRIIVSDFSEAMVAAARRQASRLGLAGIDCRVLDAERLDLAENAVDGVLCRWGYMLMADPAAALSETRRVLRPGGRLAFAVFAEAERNPFAVIPMRTLVEHGRLPPPEPGAPGILALADRERLRGLCEAAGFGEPRIEEVGFTLRFAGEEDLWDFLTGAAGAIAMLLNRLSEEDRSAARDEILEPMRAFATEDGIELPACSLVVSAS